LHHNSALRIGSWPPFGTFGNPFGNPLSGIDLLSGIPADTPEIGPADSAYRTSRPSSMKMFTP
jgi:hypothetical protein